MPVRSDVLPGAEPREWVPEWLGTDSTARTGVLLCHGFTGSPQSLAPWGEALGDAGLTVSLPRLPGHGTSVAELGRTRWEDWFATVDRAFDDLTQRCDDVFVMGLSMGGTLALRLAETRPTEVRGLVLVNPSLHADHPAFALLPALRFLVPVLRGPLGDIRQPGVTEVGYDRMSLSALHSLTELWQVTRRELGRITAPVLLYRSAQDHVVKPPSARLLRAALGSRFEERVLPESYHVATLDLEAEQIFRGSLDFVGSVLARSSEAAEHPGGPPGRES